MLVLDKGKVMNLLLVNVSPQFCKTRQPSPSPHCLSLSLRPQLLILIKYKSCKKICFICCYFYVHNFLWIKNQWPISKPFLLNTSGCTSREHSILLHDHNIIMQVRTFNIGTTLFSFYIILFSNWQSVIQLGHLYQWHPLYICFPSKIQCMSPHAAFVLSVLSLRRVSTVLLLLSWEDDMFQRKKNLSKRDLILPSLGLYG